MQFPYTRVLEIRKLCQEGKLSREDAKEQLAFVLDLDDRTDMCREAQGPGYSYGPLLRLSDVCNVLRLWAGEAAKDDSGTVGGSAADWRQLARSRFGEAWRTVDLAISKSNFLARLFLSDEGLRTQPCPEHKGKWAGCWSSGHPCACQAGGNVTGWMPTSPEHSDGEQIK
jgi:hypothetical protein